MEPEKPTRRKKAGEPPVTIDLEASPSTEEAKEAIQPDMPSDVQPADHTASSTAADEPVPAAAGAPAEDSSPASHSSARDTTAETFSQPRFDEPPKPEHRAGKSGALAAAIVGGLVALAGAGALQYGGYLPALGPEGRNGGDMTAVKAEVETLKSRLAALQSSASSAAADLQPIETRLSALERTATDNPAGATLGEEAQQSIATLEATVAKLSSDMAALREQAATAERAAADRSAQLGQRIDAAEQKLAEPRSDVAMARAVAATALKTAIDRGGPYLAELEAYVSVSPDDPSAATLRAQAATGVQSRSDLVRDFQPIADRMIEAVHQPTGDQGIVARLMASASSAITVRPVGSVEGDTPEAIVARIENKLQNGDFKGAQIEWQTLPEVARNAGADFKTALDQRITVEESVGAIVSGAMTQSGNQN
ncbi:hypothetical protein SAMN05892877_11176 [Rhizobium subbaraonis]|uniref:Inner membrane protein n=1 Tax=Rhizobium subbaraonis TaxID=908946 RepID=A0A285UNG8_9HYPH|nr:COG4223 family protein [Rhizobium subbaraonis]SOC43379.1 hypothetical protein SAMN05892877_11176 [Rhizobium subbaraonis]